MPYGKGGGGGGGGGRGGGRSAGPPLVTLEAVAATLVGAPEPRGTPPALYRWEGHEDVALVRFGSPAAQKAAMARVSYFLEDRDCRGVVPDAVPAGKMGGALAYSGHNLRAADAARFFGAAAAQGKALGADEAALRDALVAAGVLRAAPGGLLVAPSERHGVLTVCRGSDAHEARESLLHEAMHGLWYCAPAFREACWSFWRDGLSAADRASWVAFLAGLGYDASGDEELAVNEFQAYMATERTLFGGAAGGAGGKKGGKASGKSGGKASSKGRSAGGGVDGAASSEDLLRMQGAFAAFIRPHVPEPVPELANCTLVCADA